MKRADWSFINLFFTMFIICLLALNGVFNMKKSFIMTWDECQYLKGSRYEMGLQMYNFEQLTGVSVQYERQGYNGDDGSNWLWFGTNDNDGLGVYVEVKGPKEAAELLYKMCNDYRTFGEFWFY